MLYVYIKIKLHNAIKILMTAIFLLIQQTKVKDSKNIRGAGSSCA